MRVTHDLVDNEEFIDILLSPTELSSLKEGFLITKDIEMFGKKINIGVGLTLKGEYANATIQGKKSKSDKKEHLRDDLFGTPTESSDSCCPEYC